MTLSCLRFRLLMAIGLGFFGFVFGLAIYSLVTGGLAERAPGGTLGAALIIQLLLVLLVLIAGALRARVILDAHGAELVSGFGRRRLGWTEIDDITLVRGRAVWQVRLHAHGRSYPVTGLICPILLDWRVSEKEFSEPPRFTPGSLRRPYQTLRQEWLRRSA